MFIDVIHNLAGGKMYPAALHIFPTQIVDLSKVCQRWIFEKQPKDDHQEDKKLGQNYICISWTGFSPNTITIFSHDCCRQGKIYLDK